MPSFNALHLALFLRKFRRVHSAIALLLAAGCAPVETPGGAEVPDSGALPAQELWHWTTVVTQQGRKRALVRADYLMRTQEPDLSVFEGPVSVVFFDANGDTASTLTAQRGRISAVGEEMAVQGQVVVLARDSTRLETDSLSWRRDLDRIVGDGQVRIFRPDGWETGVGFEASSDLKRWTLNEVHTKVTTQAR